MDDQLLQIQNRTCHIYGDTGTEYLLLQMADVCSSRYSVPVSP